MKQNNKKITSAVLSYLKSKSVTPKRDENNVIISRRKKAARQMRNNSRTNPDSTSSTHVMEWGEGPGKYKYQVNPTIFPEKDGSWKDLGGQGMAAYKEATKRGEVIGFKRKKRAEKFAAGSWKKGEARKEAMRNYRQEKKERK
jgi:hypothetical protein